MYMPKSLKPTQTPALRASAAQLAADDEEEKPPVVPTSNMAPGKKASTYAAPAGGSTGLATTQSSGSTGTANPYVSDYVAPLPADASYTPMTPELQARANVPAQPNLDGGLNDAAYQAALASMLSGNVHGDASQQTKAITDLETNQVGHGQRDVNARMAASGFGTSGYLGAAQENMRSQAALQAAAQIADAQRRADADKRSELAGGISAYQGERGLQMQEDAYNAQKAAAQAQSNPGFHDADLNGVDDYTGASLADFQASGAVGAKPHDAVQGFGTEGDEGRPYLLAPGEEQFAQRAHWPSKKIQVGWNTYVGYQDPGTGKWYMVSPSGFHG